MRLLILFYMLRFGYHSLNFLCF